MGKINILFVVIILNFCIITSFKQKSISFIGNAGIFNKQQKDLDRNTTKEDINFTYLNGTWMYVYNNDRQDFTVSLVVNGTKITGKHCFVYGEFGDKIDCPDDNSIYATNEGDKIKGKIISDWASDSINIELKLISKDSLCLIPLSDAGESFFQSRMLFVKEKE